MKFITKNLLITTACIGSALLSIAHDSRAQGFEMRTTHKEAAGTREIEAGKPLDGIRLAHIYLPHTKGLQKVAVLTNLCIGYTMTNQLKEARKYCEEAASRPNERVVTHNNRGVLNALLGNLDAARKDFAVAANRSCESDCNESDPDHRDLPNHVARRNLRKAEARMVELASTPTSERFTAQENR